MLLYWKVRRRYRNTGNCSTITEVLFNEARTAQAATVVFSLQQNAQIEPLARSIHTLRRQRGSAMKILVRGKYR
ncbi:cellulose biosynthesis protease [Escherichia coli]|nr:cellulose biosynthesis protease [Escherichia coli]